MGKGGPSLKVGLQFLRLWHVHIFARYKNRALVPYKAEKEFAFPCFDISMVYSLKAYSTCAAAAAATFGSEASRRIKTAKNNLCKTLDRQLPGCPGRLCCASQEWRT
jgi:hypothetical protein